MALTKKLYWDDSYLAEFDATALEVRDGALVLDRTCFYPGGGGQVSDNGRIDGIGIMGVKKDPADPEVILHCPKDVSVFAPGQKVHGRIDWQKRYPTMKLHTAAHISFFVVREILGAGCTASSGKVDWEKERSDYVLPEGKSFSPDTLSAIENRVNEILAKNYTVTFAFEQVGSRDSNPWTNAPDSGISGGLRRKWKIEPFDEMECGGTHVKSTGEIGAVSIRRGKKPGAGRERLEVFLRN